MILTEKNKFLVGRNQKFKKILNRRLLFNLMWLTLCAEAGGGVEPAPGLVKFLWFTEGFAGPCHFRKEKRLIVPLDKTL